VGVIVKVDVNSMKVLTHRGIITTAKLSDIVGKRHSKFAAALDYHSNQIVKGDMVNVLQGQYQGKSGTIQHLYRGAVFIHNRSITENSGVIVVPAKHVAHTAATTMQAASNRGAFGSAAAGGASMRGGFAMRGGRGRGRGTGKFDPLFNKVVTVTSGPYKGYAGRVVVCDDTSVRVELSAITRTVQLQRNQVAERQATAAPTRIPYGLGSQTPLLGSRTPAYDAFAASRTPAYEFGGRTPAYGAAAQSFGGATPSNVWTAATPAHPFDHTSDANDEDNDELDLEQQMLAITSSQQPSTSSTSRYPSTVVPSKPEITIAPAATAPIPSAITTSIDTVAEASIEEEEEDENTAVYPESGRVTSKKQPDKQGTIESINADNSAVVRFDDNSTSTIAYTDLQAVTPEKNDIVVVLSGANKRQQGQLVGINQDEAIVEVEGDIVIVPLETLMKMAA